MLKKIQIIAMPKYIFNQTIIFLKLLMKDIILIIKKNSKLKLTY